jgi:hypothetical protein
MNPTKLPAGDQLRLALDHGSEHGEHWIVRLRCSWVVTCDDMIRQHANAILVLPAGEEHEAHCGAKQRAKREPPQGRGNQRGLGLRGQRASTACKLVVVARGCPCDYGALPEHEACQSKKRLNQSAPAAERPAGLGQPCRGPYAKCLKSLQGVRVYVNGRLTCTPRNDDRCMRRDPASPHDCDEASLLLLGELVMRMAPVLRFLPP